MAELRDIAADLAAAEREERSEARVRTEVAQRTAESDASTPRPQRGVSVGLLGAGIVLAVVVFGVLAFWNLHLRTQVTALGVLAERQGHALTELASGVSVAVDVVAPTNGLVIVDDEQVAFSFVTLPPLVGNERYVVWLVGTEDGDEPVLIGRPEDRAVAGAVDRAGADELLVTVEDGPAGASTPVGREVGRADLSAGVAPS